MPHAVDGLAEEEVAHQAVAVRADDQQIDRVVPQVADELTRGVGPVEQDRPGGISASFSDWTSSAR